MDYDLSKPSLVRKERVPTTTFRTSRLPLTEINNPPCTAELGSTQTHVKPPRQHDARNVNIAVPTLEFKHEPVQYRKQSTQRPKSHIGLLPPTSHTRYSKPYSISAFAPKSYLPNRKPPSSSPVSGNPQAKPPPSLSTVVQHTSRNPTRTRTQVTHLPLPDPRSAPPDSNIAEIWSEVHARIATMDNPPATSQSSLPTGSQVSSTHSVFDRVVASFKVEPNIIFDTQLSTPFTASSAAMVSAKLAKRIKNRIETSAYMEVLRFLLFETSNTPEASNTNSSQILDQPSVHQIVLDIQDFQGMNSKTAGLSFALAADEIWKNKFPRGYLSLLQTANLLTPQNACGEFLTIFGSSEAFYQMDILRKTWETRAKKALTKHLSISRTDPNEDKSQVLTQTRYYGYLIVDMTLEIHEMTYYVPKPPSDTLISIPESEADSGKATQPRTQTEKGKASKASSSRPEAIPKSNPPSLNLLSKPPSRKQASNPASRNPSSKPKSSRSKSSHHASASSAPSALPGLPPPPTPLPLPLPFSHTLVEKLDLRTAEDILRFSNFHDALMRWAQASFCHNFAENLHGLCWMPSEDDIPKWFMAEEEVRGYWDGAGVAETGRDGADGVSEIGAITLPERAARVGIEAWGEGEGEEKGLGSEGKGTTSLETDGEGRDSGLA